MDTVQHIAAARLKASEIKGALDRMSILVDARNPEAMLDAINDAMEASIALHASLSPLQQRVRLQVSRREARALQRTGKQPA